MLRVKRSVFERRLYSMEHLTSDSPVVDAVGAAGSAGGAGGGSAANDVDMDALGDVAPVCPPDEDAGGEADGSQLEIHVKRNSCKIKLEREFLAVALKPSSYISVGSLDAEQEDQLQVCQGRPLCHVSCA